MLNEVVRLTSEQKSESIGLQYYARLFGMCSKYSCNFCAGGGVIPFLIKTYVNIQYFRRSHKVTVHVKEARIIDLVLTILDVRSFIGSDNRPGLHS